MRVGLLTAVVIAAAGLADAQQCSGIPANALSFDCGSSCPATSACMLKTDSCDLECFASSTSSRFTFLIPFDTTVGDTKMTSSKSNDVLTAIPKWKLPTAITEIVVRGGSSLSGSMRGSVAKVQIAEDFLAGNTQLTYLRFENLNISTSFAKLLANLPTTLQQFGLKNNMVTELPTSITQFKDAVVLILSDNFITQVNETHELSQLSRLYLPNNKISSFTALYPKLTYLDLVSNNLEGVPPVVSKYTNLKELHLSGNTISEFKKVYALPTLEALGLFSANLNEFDVFMPKLTYLNLADNNFKTFPQSIFNHTRLQRLYMQNNNLMTNVKLTNQQANFIATLSDFAINSDTFSTDCEASQQAAVKGYTVCITGGAVDKSIIDGPRVVVPASASSQASGNDTASGDKSSGSSALSTDNDANAKNGHSSSRSTLSIILGCVAGVLALALVGGFVYAKKNKSKKKSKNSNSSRHQSAGLHTSASTLATSTKSSAKDAYQLWNDAALLSVKVNVDDIEDVEKIGQGGFSDVWLVTYRRSQRLASKRLREVTRTRTHEFVEEIKLVASLQHPRIVQFVGAAWAKESDLQALFELMENGDLRSYLERQGSPSQTQAWSLQKVQIAVDIAEALVYVHSFSPPLVHRDLKSGNVLLSASMQAKLTDFGVSRHQSEQNTMTAGVGTSRWLAPEVISGSRDYGAAADIFSFGVVLSELDTHKIPYDDARSTDGVRLADVTVMQLVSTGSLLPSFSPSCPAKILELAQMCLSLRPEDRPSTPEVAYALRSYRKIVLSSVII